MTVSSLYQKDGRSINRQPNTSMKNYFSEYGLPKKIMSDVDGNFMSYKDEKFCKKLNIVHAAASLDHHQTNGHMEVCIKYIKPSLKKFNNTNSDKNIALLWKRSISLGPGLPSPVDTTM